MTEIVFQISKDFDGIDIDLVSVEKLVQFICDRFADSAQAGVKYEINLAIIDDAQIRELNKKFLNRDSTTDCLSFDLTDRDELKAESKIKKTLDLAVNAEMADRQARARGHKAGSELALYITHCLLHNFGFDDATEQQARQMHDTEDEILQLLGYGIVYNS
ncbi:MAG: rRNA maturation RNase YbeY [Planctomycetota bacterium]